MKKVTRKTVFRKISGLIDGLIGRYSRITNAEYKYYKQYNFEDHFSSMLYLQFSGSHSLRDVVSKFRHNFKVKRHINIPSYSQLSRLNSNKDSDIFRGMFLDVLDIAKKEIQPFCNLKDFKDIKILDSTMVTIGSKLAPNLYYDGEKSAVRVSTLISNGTGLPDKINIVPGKIGERACIDGYMYDKNSVYLFDKGYYSYSWYDSMCANGIHFVTRQTSNAVTEEYYSSYTGVEDMYDTIVTMGTDYSKNKTTYKYREILYFEDGKDEEFRLITNIFNLPAQEIVSLYKIRWNIECFFKWIKQHLTIKHWLGHNLNAISIQIYCALIVYILLLLIKHRFRSSLSLLDIYRKISVNLNETYAIKNILTG